MDVSIVELMDEHACDAKLLAILHPNGILRPRCQSTRLMFIFATVPQPGTIIVATADESSAPSPA